ncbi:MAG: urate oxidase [Planctomycetota bacterium]|jgi:urate oxidase|nr:urate oxidase [Planctomycetota bacterium]
MSPRIASQSYGKSRVRLTKVTRHPDRHDLAELAVDILLEGAFEPSYTSGDNTAVIATDTMKNTVYALAASHPLDSPESFAAALADHFVTGKEQVTAATVEIEEAAWERIVDRSGSPHRHAFVAAGGGRRTCRVRQDQATVVVEAGIAGLAVVKTTDSAFRDFHRDDFTTLADTDDRIFGTVIEARWRYEPGLAGGLPASDFNAAYAAVRGQLVEVFAHHKSLAVQQTLYEMAIAALAAAPMVIEIELEMPNQHRVPIDLTPFGLANENAIFVTTSEPYGLIRATVRRED